MNNIFLHILLFIIMFTASYFLCKKVLIHLLKTKIIIIPVILAFLSGIIVMNYISSLIIPVILGFLFSSASINQKNKTIYTAFITIFFFALGVFINQNLLYNSNHNRSTNKDTVPTANTINDNPNIMDYITYETSESVFFTDYTIADQLNNKLNLYNVCWLIHLYELYNMEFPTDYQQTLENFINDKMNTLEQYDLQELFYFSTILKTQNKEELVHSLGEIAVQKLNDTDQGDIVQSINHASIFLQIIENSNLDTFSKNMNSAIQNIIDFSSKHMQDSLDNEEKLINIDNYIHFSKRMNQPLNDEYVDEITELINPLFDTSITNTSYSPILLSNMNRMLYISDMYQIETPFLSKIDKNKLTYDENLIYTDLQSFYRIEVMKKNLNLNIEIPPDLLNIQFWLYHSYPPSTDIIMMYYGQGIADEKGVSFNQDKFIGYLEKLTAQELVQPDLNQAYYLYLLYNKMDMDTIHLKEALSQHFQNMQYQQFESYDNKTKYTILFLDDIFQFGFYKENMPTVKQHLLNDLEKNNKDNETDFYYYFKIIELLKIDAVESSDIENTIQEIYTGAFQSIYQTYRYMDLCKSFGFEADIKKMGEFIKQAAHNEGLFYISLEDKNPESITLRSCYEGILIENYIKQS